MNHWIYAVDEAGTGIGSPPSTFLRWSYKTGDVVLTTGAINNRANEDPRIVFGSYDGKVYSFPTDADGEEETPLDSGCRGADNAPIWEFQVPTIVDAATGDEQVSKVHSSPAAAGDKIFFGANNGKVYAVSADGPEDLDADGDDDPLWETPTGSVLQPVTGSPAVANGIVVIGSEDKSVYWINAANGSILKKKSTESAVDTSPIIEGDRAFVAARDGTLYMFGPEIPRLPDLEVLSVSGVAGGLSVTIRNNLDTRARGLESPPTTVKLISGSFETEVDVPSIMPGASVVVTSSAVPGGGSIEVRAIVDPLNKIIEFNDGNNEWRGGVSLVAASSSGQASGGDDGGGGFKIPGLGLGATLAVLALALLAMRKRR
jgi:hypothetical protein